MPDSIVNPSGIARRRVLAAALGVAGAGLTGVPAAASSGAGRTAAPYSETYRPQVHFSPAENWMNDPNGLIHHDGKYHLFFQYNPSGATWGNMSWGHAVSSDLTHWEEQPVALTHDDQEMIFSGSVVYDRHNTSGLGTASEPPLVAVYTSTLKDGGIQRQSLASSTDGGTTWTKYAGNPVLDIGSKDFRDPKVFWHEPTGRWVMVLALSAEHRIRLYASPDLKRWEHLSDFGPAAATGGVWECPDLFALPLPDSAETRWVLLVSLNPGGPAGGSATQYFIGDFDGTTFTAASEETRWLDHGADAYAGVTFNDVPDGRRVLIAWMNNWQYGEKIPTDPWRGAMGFPRQLSLGAGPVLVQQPVSELAGVRGRRLTTVSERRIGPGTSRLLRKSGTSYEIEAELHGRARTFGLEVRAGGAHRTRIGYDTAHGNLFIDRTESGAGGFSEEFPAVHRAPLALDGGGLRLRILVDASSVEVYAGGGTVCLTDQIFPHPEDAALNAFAEDGDLRIEHLTAWRLDSVWR